MERKEKRFEIMLPRFKKSAWGDRMKKDEITDSKRSDNLKDKDFQRGK